MRKIDLLARDIYVNNVFILEITIIANNYDYVIWSSLNIFLTSNIQLIISKW